MRLRLGSSWTRRIREVQGASESAAAPRWGARLATQCDAREDGVNAASENNRCGSKGLLKLLRGGVVADQVFENCQDVPAIAHDAFEQRPQRGLALGLAVPLGQHRGRDSDIGAQFFDGVAAQE